MTGTESVDAVATIVTAVVAVSALVVAILGLRTWRVQLRGNAEFEVARQALRAIYKMRDAIRHVRNPHHDITEIAAATPVGEPIDFGKYRVPLYKKRWERAIEAGQELRLVEVEGEVVWGRPFIERLEPLTGRVQELSYAVADFQREEDEDGLQGRAERLLSGKIGRNAPDEFEKAVLSAISALEEFLRPKLEIGLRSAGRNPARGKLWT